MYPIVSGQGLDQGLAPGDHGKRDLPSGPQGRAPGQTLRLGLPGTLVGIQSQAHFPVSELRLQPGDSLLLYTDGIPEAMNSPKMMFGTDRLEKVLNQQKAPSMKTLERSLEEAVNAFVGNARQHDDFTILALRYWGHSHRGAS